MQFTEDSNTSQQIIRKYDQHSVTINDHTYHSSLIVSSQQLITEWPPRSLAELTTQDLLTILRLKPEIIILGTGRTFKMPPPAQLAPLIERGFSVESMDTGAACRTFSALSAEGRQVVAALIIEVAHV